MRINQSVKYFEVVVIKGKPTHNTCMLQVYTNEAIHLETVLSFVLFSQESVLGPDVDTPVVSLQTSY